MPETLAPACELFGASGYVQEARLPDYVWEPGERAPQSDPDLRSFVIPVTVDDLEANGLLGENHPQTCWERSVETLTARKNDISGLAVASEEQIEAYILYVKEGEILSLQTLVEDDGTRLKRLLGRLAAAGMDAFWIPKVHPAEISRALLETLGFRAAGVHLLHAARARAD